MRLNKGIRRGAVIQKHFTDDFCLDLIGIISIQSVLCVIDEWYRFSVCLFYGRNVEI